MAPPRPLSRAALPLLLGPLLARCALAPAFPGDERAALEALQAAVRARQTEPEDALLVANKLFDLPEGLTLDSVDLRGTVGIGARGGQPIVLLGPSLRCLPWTDAPAGILSPQGLLAQVGWNQNDRAYVACAGEALTGCDALAGVAFCGKDQGLVIAGVRHGTPFVAVGSRVIEGALFDPQWGVVVSGDGRHLLGIRAGLTGRRAFLAPVDDPTAGRALDLPAGTLQWPPVLDRTGQHWLWVVRRGQQKLLVRDGQARGPFEDVLATGHDPGSDVLWALVAEGGKQRWLLDASETRSFDAVRWLRLAAGGTAVAFVGRDGSAERGLDQVVVGGEVVKAHPRITALALSGNGLRWACVTRDQDGDRVVGPDTTLGPFAGVSALWISADGQSLGFAAELERGQQGIIVGGQRVGAEYRDLRSVHLLDGGRGCVFAGWQAGWWVVTPAGRRGPFDWVGDGLVSRDGTRLAFVARLGTEVWREVLTSGGIP